jgi:hypothetical protein
MIYLNSSELVTSITGKEPVLLWGMIGTKDPGITMAVEDCGVGNATLGDNSMHIGGSIWAAMTAGGVELALDLDPGAMGDPEDEVSAYLELEPELAPPILYLSTCTSLARFRLAGG